jgi:hypothetical protein
MNIKDKEIGFLNNHLQELAHQIGALTAKQEIAETVARKLSNELRLLQEVHRQATTQLQDIELHQSGLYMWENIGCGG